MPINVKNVPDTVHRERKRPGFKNNINQLPRGIMGKLFVYKSGKVILKAGDIKYDVSQGMPCGFLQHAAVIDTDNRKVYDLGTLQKRMIVTPDLQTLLPKSD